MQIRHRSRPRPLATAGSLLLAATLALAGCSAGGSADTKSEGKGGDHAAVATRGGGAGDPASPPVDGGPSRTYAKPTPPPAPQVIRTADLTLAVPDVPRALVAARTAAGDAGGYVGDETTERDAHGRAVSHAVLRVPEAKYDGILARLSGVGKVVTRKAKVQDVSDQTVDVESRIATQRSSVARVRKLMDGAGQLRDVVTLEGELSRRQADLDALLAQQASLRDRVALATITVGFTASGSASAEEADDGGPGVLDAARGGWDAFVTAARWLLMALGAGAPFAGAAAAGYLVWRLAVRFWRGVRGTAVGPDGSAPVLSAASRGGGGATPGDDR